MTNHLAATPSRTLISRKMLTRSALLASTMLTVATGAAWAHADTIVVTAQKREQNIQDVPISIIALGTETLDELEVSSFEDYAKYLPSVTFQSTSPNSTNIYFRGVVSGGDGNHSASLPSVGVYLDEQPVTTILGFLPVHIYDIERVEALAGPQGTLFGASSESGTLRIITNKPKLGEFEARADAEVNTIKDGEIGYQFEGMVNAPVGDNAAIRLVGWYEKVGGYIDNVYDFRQFIGDGPSDPGIFKDNAGLVEDDFNDGETFGARVALKIDLNENWTVTPTLLGQKGNFDGRSAYDPKLGDLNVGRFYDEKNEDRFYQAALTVEGKVGNFDLTYAGAYLQRQIDSFSDYTDYAYYYEQHYEALYGDYYGFYYFGAYFHDDFGNPVDPSQTYQGDDSFAKYSNEIRLSTPQDKRVRAVVGFFQNHQRHFIHQQYVVQGLTSYYEVTDHEDTIWLTEQKRTDRDLAIFTEVEFDLTDKLTLMGGVRGYKFKNSLVGFFGYNANFSPDKFDSMTMEFVRDGTGEAGCNGAPAIVPGSPCTNLNQTTKDTGETHKLSLSYDIDDDKMVYFTYSTGFRPGGVNRRGGQEPYLTDTLTNFEVGWKTSWFDNRVIFNTALFTQNWKNIQFPFLGQFGLTDIRNAKSARIKGIEADLTLAPVEGLTINGAFSLVDAKLTAPFCISLVGGEVVTDCSPPDAANGTRLPVVPDFKGTLTARYEFPVGQYTAHVQGSVSGQTDSEAGLTDADIAILGSQPGYSIFDFTAGLHAEDWELVAYISNAFDEHARQQAYIACGVCTRVQYSVNVPRTIGIRFGKDF